MDLTPLLKLYARTRRPRTSGRMHVPGLDAPVKITRDALGIPHIQAETLHDLFYAQGYTHAQDRLWQMLFNRALVAGRLAEIFGALALPADRWMRTLTMRHVATYEADHLQGESLQMLQSYADGVNSYMNAGRLPFEVSLLRFSPEPWSPVDSLSWVKMMAWNLSVNWETEVLRQKLIERMGEKEALKLEPDYSSHWPQIIASRSQAPHLVSSALEKAEAARSFSGPSSYHGLGSNNWVISGKLTRSGKPLLANDMHLGMSIPSIWYENHLQAPRFHVTGVTFPGIPGVIAGHNEKVAWGFTNGFPDVQDLYIEHLKRLPDGRIQAEFNSSWYDCTVLREEIKVKDSETVVEEVIITRHGPIINRLATDIMPIEQPLALRWTALEPNDMMKAIPAINMADSAQGLHEALRNWVAPVQNVVYADVDGNIGYTFPGKVPVRKKGIGGTPVPGWTDEYEWDSYIPYSELPHIMNPDQGYIVTANNKVVGPEYPYYLGADVMSGDRAMRITELIQAAVPGSIDSEYIRQMQFDQVSHAARRVRSALLNIDLQGEPKVIQALNMLRDWDGSLAADSAPAALYQVFMRLLIEKLLGDSLDPPGSTPGDLKKRYSGKGPTPAIMELSLHGFRSWEWAEMQLSNPDSPWWRCPGIDAGQHYSGVISAVLSESIDRLRQLLGSDCSTWNWGRLHKLYLRHPMGSITMLEKFLNRGPLPIGGDFNTVWATGSILHALDVEEEQIPVVVAPPFRFICDLGDLDQSLALLTPGQSGDPSSSHYDDQLINFFNQEGYHRMMFVKSNDKLSAKEELTLVPKTRQ